MSDITDPTFVMANLSRFIGTANVAAATLYIYDHMVTFDLEIELIWRKRWSRCKVLYLLNRYLCYIPLMTNISIVINTRPSSKFCNFYPPFGVFCWFGIIMITQIILQLRISALYNSSRRVLITLVVCFVAELIATLSVLIVATPETGHLSLQLPPPSNVIVCAPITGFRNYFVYLIPNLVFEFILFGFAFRIFLKQIAGISGGPTLLDRTSLISVIVLDNIVYYAIVAILYAVNLVIWLTRPACQYEIVPAVFSLSITSMVGCRLILHLCDVYYRPFNRQMSMWATALPMEVAERTGSDLSTDIPMSRVNRIADINVDVRSEK